MKHIKNRFNPDITKDVFDSTLKECGDAVELYEETPVLPGVLMHIKKKYGNLPKINIDFGYTLFKEYEKLCVPIIKTKIIADYISFNKRSKCVLYNIWLYPKTAFRNAADPFIRVEYGDDETGYEIDLKKYDTPEKIAKYLDDQTSDDGILKKFTRYVRHDAKNEIAEENRKNEAAIDNMELFSDLKKIVESYGFEWTVWQDRFMHIKATYKRTNKDIFITCTDKNIKFAADNKWCMPEYLRCVLDKRSPVIPYSEPEKIKSICKFFCAFLKNADIEEWDEYKELVKYA